MPRFRALAVFLSAKVGMPALKATEDEIEAAAAKNLIRVPGWAAYLNQRPATVKRDPTVSMLKTGRTPMPKPGVKQQRQALTKAYRGEIIGSEFYRIVAPLLREKLKKTESTADVKRAYHLFIVIVGAIFGMWRNTESELSMGVLNYEESAEAFNAFCPCCAGKHQPEQIRRLITRNAPNYMRPVLQDPVFTPLGKAVKIRQRKPRT